MNRSTGPLSVHGRGEVAADLRSLRTFWRQWMRDPVKVAAVAPSGRQLARMMVAQLPAGAQRVVELGAGTGVFTRALLATGIAPENLLVVELNAALAELLQQRYPRVNVVCADARHLDALVAGHARFGQGAKLDAVVSGLGMLSMSGALRTEILRASFATLGAAGRFIQFTYGPVSPVRRRERDALGLRVRRAGFAVRNLPPANVFVYERLHSREVASVRRGGDNTA